jgi:sugar phosphate isomerase/epimerase
VQSSGTEQLIESKQRAHAELSDQAANSPPLAISPLFDGRNQQWCCPFDGLPGKLRPSNLPRLPGLSLPLAAADRRSDEVVWPAGEFAVCSDTEGKSVYVSVSTECFHDWPLGKALDRLLDLEFTAVELAMFEQDQQLRPSEVLADLEGAIDTCRNNRRLDLAAFDVRQTSTGEKYYEEFNAICRLARAVKVVTITVESMELGTPFNEEVERLRKLVDLATLQGVRVGLKSQLGRLSQDPDTITVLCDNVKGLGLTLDPSAFVAGPFHNRNLEKLMKYVYHVQLRDTSKKEFQVRVGQGEVEYGRLVNQLEKVKYTHALSVNIREMPEVNHSGELRKLRLLLESLL